MKTRIRNLLANTVQHCFEKKLLERTPPPDFVVQVPNKPHHGHFATNLAMALASSQRRSPREIAEMIVEHLKDEDHILEEIRIAGPGFINFSIRAIKWHELLLDIIRLRKDYGRKNPRTGEKIMLEFVSANPTGPIHLGHGRGAALGDTLGRILSFCGYEVTTEFYVNDAGQQLHLLGESVYSRWKQARDPRYSFPENGYHGDYVFDLARKISKEMDLDRLPEAEAIELCARRGKELVLEEIKQVLSEFRVSFDEWYNESDLFTSGALSQALQTLKEKGKLYERDEALWIRTSDYGDDKDRVIRKKDGQFTYFASDISYHLEKRRRGYTKAINIWGADHHGYVPRMHAALLAHDIPKDWLSVILVQLVKLWKNGQEVRMSKRAGQYVTLQELLDEVGADSVRFVFLTKNHDSPLDFDLNLLKKKDSDNPVYYVQYAHARICSVFRKAQSEGITLQDVDNEHVQHLLLDEEMAMIRLISEFPSLLDEICATLEPHRLTYYLTDVAASFHKYFNLGVKQPEYRIITPDRAVSLARLLLAEGVRVTLANGLRLLGTTAPARM